MVPLREGSSNFDTRALLPIRPETMLASRSSESRLLLLQAYRCIPRYAESVKKWELKDADL